MQQRVSEANGIEGRLPTDSYLANPYVPFQIENPPKYQAGQAIIRGTLFPGLDLPFMGMINKNELPVTPLTELQVLSFGIQELALYLDTHPGDTDALELYREYQQLYHEGKEKYELMCGPLNHISKSNGVYRWLDGPWPWEISKNREV